MGIYVYNESEPLDFEGLTLKEHVGHTIAMCDGCSQWVAINSFYHGDRKVIRQIPHIAHCLHFERIINFMGKYK